jgi:hypothetical protein
MEKQMSQNSQSDSLFGGRDIMFFKKIILVMGGRYIGVFTKVLTMYQIYLCCCPSAPLP